MTTLDQHVGTRPIPNPKNRIKKICDTCKKEFEVVPSQKSKNCCSRKCKYEHIKVNGCLKGKRGV